MQLTSIHRKILKDILLEENGAEQPVDAVIFRSRNERYLDALDELENSSLIERQNEFYNIKILGLVELEDEIDYAQNMIRLCGTIFDVLRSFYKSTPKDPIDLTQLSLSVRENEYLVRRALTYIKETPIWGGYTSDVIHNTEVKIKPSESILRYQSFKEVIAQLIEWSNKPLFSYSPGHIEEALNSAANNRTIDELNDSSSKMPKWYEKLPPKIVSLLLEIDCAKSKNLSALPSMGFRAVIDSVCNDVIGQDIRSFEEKLARLEKEKHITPKQKRVLSKCVEIGHASIHREHFPTITHLDAVQGAVEHLLKEVYVLGVDTDEAYEAVPKRNHTKNPDV